MKNLLVIMAMSAIFLQTAFASDVILDNNCNRYTVSSYDASTQQVYIPLVEFEGKNAFSDVYLKLRSDGLFELVKIREYDANADRVAREVCNTPLIVDGGLTIDTNADFDDGNLIPVTISFDDPIVKGDVLTVKSDGDVALVLTTNGYPITEIATRIRTSKGEIIASVTRANGQINRMTHKVIIKTPATIPVFGNNSLDFQVRTQGNELKMLSDNDMPINGYIRTVNLTGAEGYFTLKLTTKMPMNPYFGFVSTKWLEDINVTATH